MTRAGVAAIVLVIMLGAAAFLSRPHHELAMLAAFIAGGCVVLIWRGNS